VAELGGYGVATVHEALGRRGLLGADLRPAWPGARGVTGLVTTTGIRDVTEIAAAGFPAWSRAVNAQGTVKAAVGQVNRPVMIGGTTVGPGDAIVADADGVVCVPRARVAEVAAACAQRERRESGAREAYRRGRLSLDVNDLRALVADLGVEYVAWAEDK
jgi:4-hydroxy-4-methyl-2-oxoglutarate aldolase